MIGTEVVEDNLPAETNEKEFVELEHVPEDTYVVL